MIASSVRVLFGAYYFLAGLNWFIHFVPDQGIDSRWFLDALAASGLFSIIKVVQLLLGGCLIANRFVPAAIAGLMPITIVIAYTNWMLEHGVGFGVIGAAMLAANAFLMLMYSEYFVPLGTLRSRPRGLSGLRNWKADWHA